MDSRRRDAPLLGRLLPALQVLSLVCLLFATLGVASVSGPWSGSSTMVGIVYAGAIPVVSALWVVRARQSTERGRAALSVTVAAALIPVAVLGAVGFTIPVLLLSVALVVVDSGSRAGYVAALAVGIAGTMLHVNSGNGVVVGLVNALPVMVLLCFGVALGSSLRAYHHAHAGDQRAIAERDQALARLEEAVSRLRRTSEIEKELLLADERARSARDLHDGLGHRLTVISMCLEFAQRTRETDPDSAWGEVSTADATARDALSEMRTWVRALSPVRDRDATGTAAFEAIAESFRGTGLEVVVEADGEDLPLSQDASLLLYRCVQEGLTNALRHGRAQSVRIALAADEQQLALTIVSDLDQEARERLPLGTINPGFGLRGLADRAAALGGTVAAQHRQGRVELSVRLDRHLAVESSDAPQELPA